MNICSSFLTPHSTPFSTSTSSALSNLFRTEKLLWKKNRRIRNSSAKGVISLLNLHSLPTPESMASGQGVSALHINSAFSSADEGSS